METMIEPIAKDITLREKLNKAASTIWAELEFARFGVTALLVVILGCIGGIAAAYAAQVSDTMVLTISITTMLAEILMLAIAPMKMICLAAAIALAADVAVYFF